MKICGKRIFEKYVYNFVNIQRKLKISGYMSLLKGSYWKEFKEGNTDLRAVLDVVTLFEAQVT